MLKKTNEVFGVSNELLPDSYVDRGDLDEEMARLLGRTSHIALRGESKCGKSWLRQQVLPDALVVQCRVGRTSVDIYRDALSQLGVRLEVERTGETSWSGRVEAEVEGGISLLARLGVRAAIEALKGEQKRSEPVGQDITDLRFIAGLIKESGRRLVVEDFHYMSMEERRVFTFDLKALWDYGVFVIIVGVWSEQNMLLYLNRDLTGRVSEIPIVWSESDLRRIFERGGAALNLRFSDALQARAIADCFENAGILQTLILGCLDEHGIEEEQAQPTPVEDIAALDSACMAYADQLNPLYQQFARQVSGGIRTRADATGIYAHAMKVILDQPEDLICGVSIDRIYDRAHERESRIQKGNLHTVLMKFEELQVDDEGRGLVLGYNEVNRVVSAVDRQLLLYRRYSTITWPWEELIAEAGELDGD